uniref:V-ATPase proteolipid subunit C-like domain-containing protein n=1 Tax=Romanomermis culicivorax TaxID=13658 RepID=A0A915KX54_ROMCU
MIGVAAVAPKRPQLIMKSLVPMIMAGVLGIYGLVSGVLIVNAVDKPPAYTLSQLIFTTRYRCLLQFDSEYIFCFLANNENS